MGLWSPSCTEIFERVGVVIAGLLSMRTAMPTVDVTPPPSARGDRLRIGMLSELYHFYMNPIMRLRGKGLEISNLPALPPEDSAAELLARFRPMWHRRRSRATGSGKALRRVVLALLSPRVAVIGVWQLVHRDGGRAHLATASAIAASHAALRRALPRPEGCGLTLLNSSGRCCLQLLAALHHRRARA